MAKKLYQYTLYKTDGTKEVLTPQPKLDYTEYYKLIGCTTFEIVPKAYYTKDMNKRATAYCDGEGLFKNPLIANPFFAEYHNTLFNDTSRIYGNVLLEEVYHGE
jgi:hypothetical protein